MTQTEMTPRNSCSPSRKTIVSVASAFIAAGVFLLMAYLAVLGLASAKDLTLMVGGICLCGVVYFAFYSPNADEDMSNLVAIGFGCATFYFGGRSFSVFAGPEGYLIELLTIVGAGGLALVIWYLAALAVGDVDVILDELRRR